MKRTQSRLPNQELLTAGLSNVLSSTLGHGKLSILRRKPNRYASTFPTEIVTCRLNGQSGKKTISFFVKYGTKEFAEVYGHRRSLAYEARVYREVLQGLGFSTPRFYGVYKNRSDAALWLIMEYMTIGVPANFSRDPEAMSRSAAWIGKFHAANEKRFPDSRLKFLRSYDVGYYVGWSRRTKRLFRCANAFFPWLATVCDEFERKVARLVEAPQTIIHGEYFGPNIVYQQGLSRPIDWQSTAIGPGEIDLAALTHSWTRRVARNCEREYARSRWPDGIPGSFQETLDMARAYMNFRWLGDPALMQPLITGTGRPIAKERVFLAMQALIDLHSVGKKLGFIE